MDNLKNVTVLDVAEPKIVFDTKNKEIDEENDDKIWKRKTENWNVINLKRSYEDDSMNSKKRRKQLKPIKIDMTNFDDMVQVPKKIIGLYNNVVGNVDDLPDSVPNINNTKYIRKNNKKNLILPRDVDFMATTTTTATIGTTTIMSSPKSEEEEEDEDEDELLNEEKMFSMSVDKNDINVPNIDTGPKFLTNPHFMFPLSFQTMTNSNNYFTEANLKIFNQEAYCELCKKEFCNKYFLKTHKANKHGIYTDVLPMIPPVNKINMKIEGKDDGTTMKSFENGGEMGEETGDCTQTAFCDICNKKFCNKYFVKKHKNKCHGTNEDDDIHGLLHPCHKEIHTKLVQNISNDSTKETDSTLIMIKPLALTSSKKEENDESDNHDDGQKENADDEQLSPLNLIMSGKETRQKKQESVVDDLKKEEEVISSDDDVGEKNDGNGEEDNDDDDDDQDDDDEENDNDDECSSENIEKLQTMLLRLNPSDIESSKTCKVCNDVIDNSDDQQHKCNSIHLENNREKINSSETNESSNDSKIEFETAKMENQDYFFINRYNNLKQMKPTSSYCEICNKELCNKYFMRTHMQRMHGIEIEHGAQIGGVVCNICNKELCSKYFLRVHKQNTHGIMSPNSILGPSTSGNVSNQRIETIKPTRGDSKLTQSLTQACYICNKRFRSPKWLQAHFASDHREETTNTTITITTTTGKTESNDSAEGNSKEEQFGSSSSSSLPTSKDNNHSSDTGVKLKDNPPEGLDVISKIFWENDSASKTFNCSRCPFTTSVLAFLFVHERSHFVLSQDPSDSSSTTTTTTTTKSSSSLATSASSLQNLIRDKAFWQHKITQELPECLDLSGTKSKYVRLEQNGS